MPLFGGSKGKYECRVILLDNNEQKHEITHKTFGDELLSKVFSALNLYEKEYFGLRYKDRNGEAHWLDPNKIVKKQMLNHNPPFILYFGVKFYAADPTKLREEITRIPCEDKIAADLCAYCVQSELGDFDPSLHTDGFISEFRFVPQQTIVLENMITETYPKLKGMIPAEAEFKFLERVKWLEMYGVDLHQVKGQDNMEYLLGLTPTGIVLFKNKSKIGSFIWPKITKLKYKGNCFLLRATQGRNNEEKEYTFICINKDYAKNLWKNCAEHHTFFRLEKANDVPASAYNFLFRKGSGFKFSGRTQQELERDVDKRPRNEQPINRKPSQRFTRRSQENLSYIDGADRDLPKSPISNASTISAPWEAAFTQQSGLYSNGKRNSFPNKPHSMSQERGTSPKFSRRATGYCSSGEAETKRKRSHYYSGYTSATDVESNRTRNSAKYGSAPNIQYKTNLYQDDGTPSYVQQNIHRHHRHHSRESLPMVGHVMPHMDTPNSQDRNRRYRPSGSKSDSEESSRRRRHQHHHYQGGAITDNEMVAPLDIYRNSMGVATGNEEERRRRHRHHHHSQHRQQRNRHSGYQYDPNQAELLLELGPDSASAEVLTGGYSAPPSASNKENMNPMNGVSYRQYSSSSMPYQSSTPTGVPGHTPQRFIHQYLPAHLLKQSGRPPMTVMHSHGSQAMYRPQYVEQYCDEVPYNYRLPFTRSRSVIYRHSVSFEDRNSLKSDRSRPKSSIGENTFKKQ
ncbi:band 4.1-like protein 4 isoform X3 [Hydractinia symbiolongicarpus]|uniref:band 4.1-like protein 4 isoform X3 n=1 Tax=Hydractinia symbiolongicarpus TaxID=13093 RepID=UPI00254D03A1|nr:band 4.1-like protein 4 isoform X3 [Hydractinia symbiolongicarpus]